MKYSAIQVTIRDGEHEYSENHYFMYDPKLTTKKERAAEVFNELYEDWELDESGRYYEEKCGYRIAEYKIFLTNFTKPQYRILTKWYI